MKQYNTTVYGFVRSYTKLFVVRRLGLHRGMIYSTSSVTSKRTPTANNGEVFSPSSTLAKKFGTRGVLPTAGVGACAHFLHDYLVFGCTQSMT